MRGYLIHILSLLALLFSVAFAYGQKTVVSGRVIDKDTKEPIMFSPVYFVGTKSGTNTDENGNYRIETFYSSDSLRAQSIGYTAVTKKIKQGTTMVINFELSSGAVMETIVIKPKDEPNPAIELMKKVIKNKKINNREKLDAYEYEAYNKVEFDLNNISKLQDRKLLKPFDFIFEGMDTTQEKVYLPVFMTESLSDYYFKRDPKFAKEVIKATKVSGIENSSINQFLGDMYQNVNVYDNEIIAFNKSFTSPLSTYALGFYDYGLVDSAFIDNKWCYKLQFFPRRKQELLFFGEMWVNDTTYAVKSIEATIAEGANINWIKQFKVNQEFNEVEPEVWMLTKDQLLIDFNLSDKQMGIYGRKTSTYKDFVINKQREEGFYAGLSDIEVKDDASLKDDAFWDAARHIDLSDNEQRIYHMVDTLKSLPQFKTVADIINLFVNGYRIIGPIELGPYYKTFSFNVVEGGRFRIGGRTSNDFSKRLMLDGYVAYGLKDERYKYGGGFLYIMKKNPRMAISMHAKHDLEQLGQSDNAFSQDNILGSLFRSNASYKLTDVIEYTGYFEKEWLYGLSNKLIFTNRTLRPAGNSYQYNRFDKDLNTEVTVNNLVTTEIGLYTRFAYKEKFVYGEFERISLGTKHPTLEIMYTVGVPNIMGSQFKYQKFQARVSDKWRFGPFGYLRWTATVGKIFGNLPYPLLMLHQGNQTFFYDESAYNTMNFFEFVSDEWASVWATYHAEGLLLNKIPLMRRLKWREVLSAKMVVGGYDINNDNILSRNYEGDALPDVNLLTKPFVETAVGIENIFKVFRVDFIWRLSYLDHDNIVRYGIRAKFQIDF